MELTLEQIQTELKTWKGKVEEKVKEIVGSSDSDAKIAELKAQIDKIDSTLKNVEEQIKQSQAAGLPGLSDDLKK